MESTQLIDLVRRQTQAELFRMVNKRPPTWLSTAQVTREYGLKWKKLRWLEKQGRLTSRPAGFRKEWDELMLWILVTNLNMKKDVKSSQVITYSRVAPLEGESPAATESRLSRQVDRLRGFVTSNGLPIGEEVREIYRGGLSPELNKIIERILLGEITVLVVEEPSRVGYWNWGWLQDLCYRKGVALMAPSRKPTQESRLEVKDELAEHILRWKELASD